MSGQLKIDVAELRREFDERFAEPVASEAVELATLLLVRVGGQRFAIPARHIAALARCPTPTPVPSSAPTLIGLIALRGLFIPVFDLASLLGFPARDEPRWIVTCDAETPVAFAFGEYEAHLRVPAQELEGVVSVEGSLHRIVSVNSLLASIGAGAARSTRP